LSDVFTSFNDQKNKINQLNTDLNSKSSSIQIFQASQNRKDSMPPLTYVKSTAWTSQNLTKVELYGYFGLKQIKEALTDADWEAFHNDKKPAFCYHKWDVNKEYGILLNVHALMALIFIQKLPTSALIFMRL
jgi:hypothetical protein